MTRYLSHWRCWQVGWLEDSQVAAPEADRLQPRSLGEVYQGAEFSAIKSSVLGEAGQTAGQRIPLRGLPLRASGVSSYLFLAVRRCTTPSTRVSRQVAKTCRPGNPAKGRICRHIIKLENLREDFDPLMLKYNLAKVGFLQRSLLRLGEGREEQVSCEWLGVWEAS